MSSDFLRLARGQPLLSRTSAMVFPPLPAPSITSVTPNNGADTGGTSVLVAGLNFRTGATVSFGGTPATGVNVLGSMLLSCNTPAHAVGAVTVSVTNPDGQSGILANAFTYTSAFTPADLTLSGYWKASYSGSPWVGTASAGASGGRNLTEATNAPSVGSAVNGLTPAHFGGSNSKLGGAAVSTYMTVAAYGGWVLLNVPSISTNSAFPSLYDNVTIWSNGAFGGLVLRSNNTVTLFHFDGGQKNVAASFTTGTWQLVQWKFDGSNLKIRVNGGAWQTTPGVGNSADTTSTFYLSQRYDGTSDLSADVLEVGLFASAQSDANDDNVLSYDRTHYALALT